MMALRSQKNDKDRKTRVFISYSRKDVEFAQLLKVELEASGFQPMLDKTDIAPGEAWQDRLGKLIVEADAVVFCVSPNSAASKICVWEIEEASRLAKNILPAVLDPVDVGNLPEVLARLNFIFFTDASFDEAFAKIKSALNTDLDWVRQHTRLGEQAIEWEARGRTKSRLLPAAALLDAESWIAAQPKNANAPTPLQHELILASRSAETRKQRRRVTVAVGVAALSLALLIWGELNRQRANTELQVAVDGSLKLVDSIVSQFRTNSGVPVEVMEQQMNLAVSLTQELKTAGIVTNSLLRSEIVALEQLTKLQLAQSKTVEGLATATAMLDVTKSFDTQLKRDPENEFILALAYKNLFEAQRQSNEPGKALESADSARKELETLLAGKTENRDFIEKLAAENANDMGSILIDLNRFADALKFLEQAQTKFELIFKTDEKDLQAASSLVVNHDLQGLALRDSDPPKALEHFRIGLTKLEPLADQALKDNRTLALFANINRDYARQLSEMDRGGEGKDPAESAHTLSQILVDRNPGNAQMNVWLGVSLSVMGQVYNDMSQSQDASKAYKEALTIFKDEYGRNNKASGILLEVARCYAGVADAGENPKENYQQALDTIISYEKEQALDQETGVFKTKLEQALATIGN